MKSVANLIPTESTKKEDLYLVPTVGIYDYDISLDRRKMPNFRVNKTDARKNRNSIKQN